MVSLRQTSLKYHGRKAETYDAIRTKQARWALENETVERWLRELRPKTVLDCPVGTGRYLKMYAQEDVEFVTGVDISDEMIALARRKIRSTKQDHCHIKLVQGGATKIEAPDQQFEMSVCVRFLDLIDDVAMRAVVTELARVTLRYMILTIRLGDRYVPKSNTAEHDGRKFKALTKRLGFRIRDTVRFREGDWNIMLLERAR